jgi:GT2 family glycosyltransferase
VVDEMTRPRVGAVVLHMGDRPVELQQALADLTKQQGVELDVLVVGNGWRPTGLPEGVRSRYLPENVGIPEGRNVGAREVRGDFIFFFDDDATIPARDVLARLVTAIEQHSHGALCQPRLSDPITDRAPRRWVPRLYVRPEDGQGGQVATFSEGVVMMRRAAFEDAGGWPGQFFFGHEGIEMAWQLIDRGWTLWYDPAISVHHPYTEATRHPAHYFTNARNRVWVARRNLPVPLVPPYLMTWAAITALRTRDREALAMWCRGFAEGVRKPAGRRRPISWRAVARLTRVGRPPVV